jgi:hypothetical protein
MMVGTRIAVVPVGGKRWLAVRMLELCRNKFDAGVRMRDREDLAKGARRRQLDPQSAIRNPQLK